MKNLLRGIEDLSTKKKDPWKLEAYRMKLSEQ